MNRGDDQDGKCEVLLFKIPSRGIMKWNYISFKIIQAGIFWSSDGKFVSCEFYCKRKKKLERIIQCGFLNYKQERIYASNLDIKQNSKQLDLNFSQNGKNFVLASLNEKNKTLLEFYTLSDKVEKPRRLYELTNQNKKKFFFSPNSKFLIFAENKSVYFSEFKMIRKRIEFKIIKEIEVSSYKDIKWSPCSRYVAFVKSLSENLEITLHDSYGRAIDKFRLNKMNNFDWRSYTCDYLHETKNAVKTKYKEEIRKNVEEIINVEKGLVSEHKKNTEKEEIA